MTAARRKLLDAAKAQNMKPKDLDAAIEINLIVIRKTDNACADVVRDRILNSMIAGDAPYRRPLRRRKSRAA